MDENAKTNSKKSLIKNYMQENVHSKILKSRLMAFDALTS